MPDRELTVNTFKLSVHETPVDVRTLEVHLTYDGQDLTIVLPIERLADGIDAYYGQAEDFFRRAADEVARFRRHHKAPGYEGD